MPRLPLPDLGHTLELYLETVRPLLTDEEFAKTSEVVAEFGQKGGIGQQLTAKLAELKAKTDAHTWDSSEFQSWLEEMWDTLAYFRDRNPLPCNVNVFGTVFASVEPFTDHLSGAALIIHGCLLVKNKIEDNTLQPDCIGRKGQLPLCMYQYKRIFATTRIPKEGQDELKVYDGSRHMVVVVDGVFYTFDAVREDGSVLDPSSIRLQLVRIWKMANRDAETIRDPGMGRMTYEGRDEWAAAREHMLTNPTNARSLRTIERSLFVMCLSRNSPTSPDELMYEASVMDGKSIWNDKSVNLTVYANGKTTFNGEHSASDAPVPSRMLNDMAAWVQANRDAADGKAEEQPMPRRLTWEVDEVLEKALAHATETATTLIANHKLKTVWFKGFGKKFLKAHRCQPDSFMQVALQLAYYRDQGTFTATYESATMRTFLHGRTECIRSCTSACKDFVLAFEDASVATDVKLEKFRAAAQAHLFFLQQCMLGQGVDRHLLGMRVMAFYAGLEPEIFSDAGYVKSTKWDLSTSQMAYQSRDWPGFGAPFPDSYGTCYVCALPDELLTCCSSNATCKGKDATRFAAVLERCFADLGALLASGDSKM